MQTPIFADIEATWPPECCELLVAGLSRIKEYEKDRAEIDMRCRIDPVFRCGAHKPKHADFRAQLIGNLNTIINTRTLACYHATRLHSEECSTIKSGGLCPLSQELLYKRIRRQVELGNLNEEIAERLLSCNAVNNRYGRRLGMIHFCFSRTPLTDKSGMYRLFRYWGGEALYYKYEGDVDVGPLLKNLGKPTIVLAEVPINAIKSILTVGEYLLNQFSHNRRVIAHSSSSEGHICRAIAGDNIISLFSLDDPEFESLTSASQWKKCGLSID